MVVAGWSARAKTDGRKGERTRARCHRHRDRPRARECPERAQVSRFSAPREGFALGLVTVGLDFISKARLYSIVLHCIALPLRACRELVHEKGRRFFRPSDPGLLARPVSPHAPPRLFARQAKGKAESLDAVKLSQELVKRFAGQVTSPAPPLSPPPRRSAHLLRSPPFFFAFSSLRFAGSLFLPRVSNNSFPSCVVPRQVLSLGQRVSFELVGVNYVFEVSSVALAGKVNPPSFFSSFGVGRLVGWLVLCGHSPPPGAEARAPGSPSRVRAYDLTLKTACIQYYFAERIENARGTRQEDDSGVTRGMLAPKTAFVFESANAGIKITNQRSEGSLFKTKEFSFQKLGIGGLDNQFSDIFRRAFSSRVYPPSIIAKLGIKHVKARASGGSGLGERKKTEGQKLARRLAAPFSFLLLLFAPPPEKEILKTIPRLLNGP